MPTVYAYGRASTGRQTITEDHQRSVCEEFVTRSLVPDGYTYGGWLYDNATSGTSPRGSQNRCTLAAGWSCTQSMATSMESSKAQHKMQAETA